MNAMPSDIDHRARRAKILRAHPDVRSLYGPDPMVAVFGVGAIVLQFGLAFLATRLPWWGVILLAFGVGAFVMHAINCVVHECTHNLVFRDTWPNKAFALLVSLPGLTPSSVAFRHYHLLHHSFFGTRHMDSDVASRWEVRVVGRSASRKLVWLLLLPISYTMLHPLLVRQRLPLDGWLIANVVSIALTCAAIVTFAGWPAIAYLLISTYLSVGPHPAGAHILQEHIAFDGGDGMASYYGPVNLISVNLGYHLEHHDLPHIAGWRLPQLRRLAPQFYTNRFRHLSRLRGLWQFVTDSNIGLDSRPIKEIDAGLSPSA
jgi:sphingolipid delta-4 desaturase